VVTVLLLTSWLVVSLSAIDRVRSVLTPTALAQFPDTLSAGIFAVVVGRYRTFLPPAAASPIRTASAGDSSGT